MNRTKLGAAVKAWLEVLRAGGPAGEDVMTILDEADIALDAICIEEGVYAAGIEATYETCAAVDGIEPLVHIFLPDRILQIDTEGNVERF